MMVLAPRPNGQPARDSANASADGVKRIGVAPSGGGALRASGTAGRVCASRARKAGRTCPDLGGLQGARAVYPSHPKLRISENACTACYNLRPVQGA